MSHPVLRAAIVGCGQIAGGYDAGAAPGLIRTHARAYQQAAGVELTAAADVAAVSAEAFVREWKIPRAYGSLAQLLEFEKPDLVSICTPDGRHADDLRACLASPGVKAIWCEKPLALNLDDAREMVAIAAKKNVILAVNYQRQWEASHIRLAAEIHSEEWGKLLGGHAVYSKGIFHNGSHMIALLRGLLGEPTAMKVHRAFYDYSPDDPTVDATLTFQGAPVQLLGLPIPPYAVFELRLFFERGSVSVKDSGKKIIRQRLVASGSQLLDEQIESTELDQALARVLEDILRGVRTGSPVRVDGPEALRTLEICHELSRQVKSL